MIIHQPTPTTYWIWALMLISLLMTWLLTFWIQLYFNNIVFQYRIAPRDKPVHTKFAQSIFRIEESKHDAKMMLLHHLLCVPIQNMTNC